MEDPGIRKVHATIIEDDGEDFHDLLSSLSVQGDARNPISVEKYTYDLALQEALLRSISRQQSPTIILSDAEEEEEEQQQEGDKNNPIFVEEESLTSFQETPSKKSLFNQHRLSISETGQSSNSKPVQRMIFCQICMEPKHPEETLKIKGCSHVFCSDCIRGHVAAKIQENQTAVRCPDLNCDGVIEPEFCLPILPPEVFERWCSVLCESLILGSMKFYCPFKDCSALLVDERGAESTVVIKESECPICRRLFCAQCKVPWHADVNCEEFQKLNTDERNREDIMLMNLAKENKWQRCPKCGFYVERIDGCLFMRCRCRHGFCYHCGGPMTSTSHYCTKCKR